MKTTTTTPPKRHRQKPTKLRAFLGELREQQDKQPAPRMLYDLNAQAIVYL